MVKFKLNTKDIRTNLKLPTEYKVVRYTQNNSIEALVYFDHLINQFYKEYIWEGMFTVEDVQKRLKEEEEAYILFYTVHPIGYCFIKNGHIYNFFVSHEFPRSKDIPVIFCNKVLKEYIYNRTTLEHFLCECEDWNRWGQRIFLENNFLVYE